MFDLHKNLAADEDVRLIKPSLPPLEEMLPLLEEIWDSRTLTNGGPMSKRFEAALGQYLGTPHISLVANATLGLVASLFHLKETHGWEDGEVITTPFTFVATANAVKLAGLEPVFADIDPVTLSLDPEAVRRQITPRTRAILGVHAFGQPGDMAVMEGLAEEFGLPLIYDAAHAFGAVIGNRSLASYGDLSILSFHATKVFNTFEGGAIICPDAETKARIDRFCNHGIQSETEMPFIGINAKMSELHAAVGVKALESFGADLQARRGVSLRYGAQLCGVKGIDFVCPVNAKGHNHYAFPIRVREDFRMSRDELHLQFKAEGVCTRRYFHPMLSDLPAFRDHPSANRDLLPNAAEVSGEVLCLPMFPDLPIDHQQRVIEVIRGH